MYYQCRTQSAGGIDLKMWEHITIMAQDLSKISYFYWKCFDEETYHIDCWCDTASAASEQLIYFALLNSKRNHFLTPYWP